MAKFGSVTLGKVRGSSDLKRLLEATAFSSEVVIIKPSWYSPHSANFTDAETLGMLIDALDAVLCGLIGVDPEKVSYITLGEEAFGTYDRRQMEKAKAASRDWFPS